MRSVIALMVLLEALILPANALTEARSFTSSDIISETSNFTSTKTILSSAVSTADINFQSIGELNSNYNLTREGIYQINQGTWTSLDNSLWYNGWYVWNNSFSGAHIIDGQTMLSGTGKTEFGHNRYFPVAMTENAALATSDGSINDYSAIFKSRLDSDISNPIIIDNPNPIYNFRTQGDVGTEFQQNCNGTYKLNQGIITSPDNYWGLYGRGGFYSPFYNELENKSGFYNSQHSTFSGSGVSGVKTFSYGNIVAGFPDLKDPEQSDARRLETNITSAWNIDQPADLLKQDITLNFRTADDQVAYSGYDATRELAIGGIDCVSEMELSYRET